MVRRATVCLVAVVANDVLFYHYLHERNEFTSYV